MLATWQFMFLQKPVYVQVTHAMCMNTSPYHQRYQLLNCVLTNFDMSDHWIVFASVHLNELWPSEGGGVCGSGLSMDSSLHSWVSTCICGCSDELCSQYSHSSAYAVMPMTEPWLLLIQCCLRAQRSRPSNIGFGPCPMRKANSSDSLNLLVKLCTYAYMIMISTDSLQFHIVKHF